MNNSDNNKKEIMDSIVDLLRKRKLASRNVIAHELGISVNSCKDYLRDLRRNHPNISAIYGTGYIWVDSKESEDTGISNSVRDRQDSIYEFIKTKGKVSYKDLAEYTGMRPSTINHDITRIKSIHDDIQTFVANGGGVYYVTTDSSILTEVLEDRVAAQLSIDTPRKIGYICEALGYQSGGVINRIRSLIDRGKIVRTGSRSYVLVSDCPANKLNDDSIKAWFYIKNHRVVTRTELYKAIGSKSSCYYVYDRLKELPLVSENISVTEENGEFIFRWVDSVKQE